MGLLPVRVLTDVARLFFVSSDIDRDSGYRIQLPLPNGIGFGAD